MTKPLSATWRCRNSASGGAYCDRAGPPQHSLDGSRQCDWRLVTVEEEEAREAQVSEAQIAVHWREEECHYPPATFIGQANASDPAIFGRFGEER